MSVSRWVGQADQPVSPAGELSGEAGVLPAVVPQMNTVMLDGVDLSRGWALRGERGGIVPPIAEIPDNSRVSRFGVGGCHSFS